MGNRQPSQPIGVLRLKDCAITWPAPSPISGLGSRRDPSLQLIEPVEGSWLFRVFVSSATVWLIHSTAAWTAQQIRNAFPWDTAPRFLLRDRDGTYGQDFRACLEAMGIDEVLMAPQSPWQNPYVERLIGSMRRECVDHVIVLNKRSLQRILRSYVDYYHHWRTHLSLGKDAPAA